VFTIVPAAGADVKWGGCAPQGGFAGRDILEG